MLGRFVALVVAIGVGCVGCFPSKEAQSAGAVGCLEDELSISDENSGFSSETWVVTCDGRRYVCSRNTMGPTAYQNPSCTLEGGSQSKPAKPEPAPAAEHAAAADSTPPKAASEPPTGAGGFRFGQTRDEVTSACTGGNFELTPTDKDGARCSGLLTDLGFKAAAQFGFCGDLVCKIALVLDATGPLPQLLKSFQSIEAALSKKYGAPATRVTTVPPECSKEAAAKCLKDGRINLQRAWAWPGTSVRLSLNQPEGAPQPRFVVLYTQAKREAEASPDAL